MNQLMPINVTRLTGSLLILVMLSFTAPVLASDDVVVDFGDIGLWARMNDANWLKLSNTSPTEVVTGDVDANGEDDVIAVFGSGIFIKRNLGGWVQLHNSIPDAMAVCDLDDNGQDDVVIDFGAIIGLYARMNDASWVKLSNTSPSQIVTGDIDGSGKDDVIAVFGGGIFINYDLDGWIQLHNSIPDSMAVGDLDNNGEDDLVVDFGAGIGLYAWMNGTNWLKLHNGSPDLITTGDIDGNGADDVVATFGSSFGGSWQKLNLGGWTQLSDSAADEIVTGNVNGTGAEDIIASFATSIGGIFVKRDQGAWSQLHNFNPDSIAVGNIDRASTTPPLNDTGFTWGGNYPSGNNSTCIGETISQQDCSHGRDALNASGNLVKIGAGRAGFDFSKLDALGDDLLVNAPLWSCVRDNHTSLYWEVKTDDGGIRDKDNSYRWGGKTSQLTSSFGTLYGDWDSLVDEANSSVLCGFTDWRVPSRVELSTLVDYSGRSNAIGGASGPNIDTDYFPNTGSVYWSSSPRVDWNDAAWSVVFGNGRNDQPTRKHQKYVRLVRSNL